VFLDLDDFKDINDRHGHDAGDAVLRSVVERLRTALGRGASIGRLGGDEFLVILPGVAGADEELRLAEEVRLASQHQVTYGEAVLPVSGSVGVAWAGPGRIDAADLITRADEAMYRSKRDRRSGPGPSE
jgi:diguanylate cyclase (GGDEF)-like protein